MDCVSVFARTVELALKVLEATMGYDQRDPYSRQLDLSRQSWGTSLRFGVPSVPEFFGDQRAEAAFAQLLRGCAAWVASKLRLSLRRCLI